MSFTPEDGPTVSKSTDERGRLYLPAAVRERYGDRYRIVELPSHVALFPVHQEPLEGLRDAVGDALDGADVAALKADARRAIDRRARSTPPEDDPDGGRD